MVRESREIRILNDVVTDRLAIKDLENGVSLTEVYQNQRPADERLLDLILSKQKEFGGYQQYYCK